MSARPDLRVAYLRFDVRLPAGSRIRTARLLLTVRDRSGPGGLQLASAAGGAWRETTLTWRRAPRRGTSPRAGGGSPRHDPDARRRRGGHPRRLGDAGAHRAARHPRRPGQPRGGRLRPAPGGDLRPARARRRPHRRRTRPSLAGPPATSAAAASTAGHHRPPAAPGLALRPRRRVRGTVDRRGALDRPLLGERQLLLRPRQRDRPGRRAAPVGRQPVERVDDPDARQAQPHLRADRDRRGRPLRPGPVAGPVDAPHRPGSPSTRRSTCWRCGRSTTGRRPSTSTPPG